MSRSGPTLSTLALQQVGSYLGYTGRNANGAAKAARDPERTFEAAQSRAPPWGGTSTFSPQRVERDSEEADKRISRRPGTNPGPLASTAPPAHRRCGRAESPAPSRPCRARRQAPARI